MEYRYFSAECEPQNDDVVTRAARLPPPIPHMYNYLYSLS